MNASARIIDTIFWSLFIWNFGARPMWPWDLKGKRKKIKLNTRERRW